MRYWSAVVEVVLVAAGCGQTPEGPPPVVETRITAEIDWPLAREPGFVDTKWYVWGDSDYIIGPSEGPIPATGAATAQFRIRCVRGRPIPATVFFSVRGHFESREDDWPCMQYPRSITCTEAPQSLVLTPPSPDSFRCFPPNS